MPNNHNLLDSLKEQVDFLEKDGQVSDEQLRGMDRFINKHRLVKS